MIEDENHPEWVAVTQALIAQVASVFNQEGFTQRAMDVSQEICNSATRKAKERGLRFPDIAVAYFIRARWVALYDREASHDKKQQYIVQLIRDGVTDPRDIAEGFKRVWPDYNPHVEEKKSSLRGPLTFPEEKPN